MKARRNDEILMYQAMRVSADKTSLPPLTLVWHTTFVDYASHLRIPKKRAQYLAEKWQKKGWLSYADHPGLPIEALHIMDDAPVALLAFSELR